MDSDLAHVNFTVQHAAREAFEIHLPRLRGLLEDSGLLLGDVDVSTSSQQDEQRETSSPADQYDPQVLGNDDEDGQSQTKVIMNARATRQIIDAFA